MKQKSEVLAATKHFAKEVGAPDAIICDMDSEQLYCGVKQFRNAMGMTLRVLEEGTPWSNKAELYIKLMTEAVRKDMRKVDSPLPFWDYCLEWRVWIYNLTARDHIKIKGMMPHTATTGEEGIFQTSANTSGMTGVTTEITQQTFHAPKKSLGMC